MRLAIIITISLVDRVSDAWVPPSRACRAAAGAFHATAGCFAIRLQPALD